ncbi:MAG: EamA family transporter [Acidobacteriota bacterium]
MMIATALAWSITIPLDKLAVARSEAVFHGFTLTAGMTLGALGLIWQQGASLKVPEASWKTFSLGLLFCVGALMFQLWALTQTFAGIVETGKRCIANIMALVFGQLTFQESITRPRLLAVALMVFGVVLILGPQV